MIGRDDACAMPSDSGARSFRSALCCAIDWLTARTVFLALAVFIFVGLATLDDYGVTGDAAQRQLGLAAVNYVLGDGDALPKDHNQYYGVAFEVPLVLAERFLNLADSREIFLSRHLLTHLSFLVGGLFCALLAQRLFRNRWLALFALLIFLLHPRLYAHSIFDTKNIPFLSMFMIALYLFHRAFRRDRIGAFALLGASLGLLVSLRIMGVLLVAAVLALRLCDLCLAGAGQRRRILATGVAFALACALTLYAVSPALWNNPLGIVEAFAILPHHPSHVDTLFQGELVRWPQIPAHYLPTWMAITTPPIALLLSLVGMAALLCRASLRPGEAFRNAPSRFWFVLLACPALGILAVIALNANINRGWHHMYFLCAPLSLLALFGLHWLTQALPRPALRKGVWMLAAAGLAATVVEMILLHPHQQFYFNFLIDRSTPEQLRAQYHTTAPGRMYREGLEQLLRVSPSSTFSLSSGREVGPNGHAVRNRSILPLAERTRIRIADGAEERSDYYIGNGTSAQVKKPEPPFAPVVYARKIYNNSMFWVTARDLSLVDASIADAYRDLHRSTTSGTPVAHSDFDLYLDGNRLTWVKAPCGPVDVRGTFLLRVFPVDLDNLPWWRRKAGFDRRDGPFVEHGVQFDGKCLMQRRLPAWPIRAIEAGQFADQGAVFWLERIDLPLGKTAAIDPHRAAWTLPGAPVARGRFDLHLDGPSLTYFKENCRPEDTAARFFLHLVPSNPAELPAHRRANGFDNLDFDFWENGLYREGQCLASIALPDYDILRIRTGQLLGERQLWRLDIPVGD